MEIVIIRHGWTEVSYRSHSSVKWKHVRAVILSDKSSDHIDSVRVRVEIVTILNGWTVRNLWITRQRSGTCESCHISDKSTDHIDSDEYLRRLPQFNSLVKCRL